MCGPGHGHPALTIVPADQPDSPISKPGGPSAQALPVAIGKPDAVFACLILQGQRRLTSIVDLRRLAGDDAVGLAAYLQGNREPSIQVLYDLARLSFARRTWERSAYLLGARDREIQTFHGGVMGMTREKYEEQAEQIVVLKQEMGEAEFAAAFAAGRTSSREQTIAYAQRSSELDA